MRKFFARLLPPLPLIFPAVISGLALTLCFPPFSLWPLCFVAAVPLMVALLRRKPSRKEAFKAGFLCGVVFFVTLLWWIVKLLPTASVTIPWLMAPALILTVLYLSLFPAFFCLLLPVLTRYRLAAIVLVAPALWVLLEKTRSVGELAFPWGVVGYALSDTPSMIQSAEFFGLEGLSFAVLLVNVLVSLALAGGRARTRMMSAAGAVLVVGGPWLYGCYKIGHYEIDDSKTVKVAVVQPNVDLALKWKREFRDSTFNLIERLARESASHGAELVVFPETCAPVYIEGREPKYKKRLSALAVDLKVPIFTGLLDHRFDGPNGELNIFNSSGLFRVDGTLDKYDKNHLLPFGENLPLSAHLRWLRKINFGQSNFQPGPSRAPIEINGGSFTPLICFESVLDYLCRRAAREGANFFVNITNDGWFGDTPGPMQHAQMCLLRTVENRRYLVRSANSGVSLVVDPLGRVIKKLGLYEQGILLSEVALLDRITFYSKHGHLPALVFCVILVVLGTIYSRRLPGSAAEK